MNVSFYACDDAQEHSDGKAEEGKEELADDSYTSGN